MDSNNTNSKKENHCKSRERALLRIHSHVFLLNDDENRFFLRFLEKYKIENKARFIRETLMVAMLTKTDEDHPTLF
ncbi:MAG: hypothetical protein LBB41_00220 [Prevotellaceae bacterium]|jgi:hypothetical protein|nr:hypothetical protein [Prevotellaceae bacterium]